LFDVKNKVDEEEWENDDDDRQRPVQIFDRVEDNADHSDACGGA
jgi:hypothetical protein